MALIQTLFSPPPHRRGLRRRQHVDEERPSEHQAEQQRVPSHPGQGRVRGHHGVRHGREVLQRAGRGSGPASTPRCPVFFVFVYMFIEQFQTFDTH